MSISNYKTGVISPEQFIAEHSFAYIIKGEMQLYDGEHNHLLRSGEFGLARKNRLVRFKKEMINGELEKVFVFFDEPFLRKFQEKHHPTITNFPPGQTIIKLPENELLPNYIQSLLPHYDHGLIAEPFKELKREELLIILLQASPELTGILFDFGIPQKINIEAFMNQNYHFNVSNERFAFLTGRSLSAFKRDFRKVFHDTPGRWLVQKRLQEAYFLIDKQHKKISELYLDLGFETLSHFSYAFKKHFGFAPTELTRHK
ncbi:hypothetical protein GCM10023149_08420 [Mucilaginibacter gynuensis]|uniref:HTH araC/xylS-type domain-containing protein n=1 Tax=Mucilaginibacter gynuensis TaxID=1302236 RepID=A0ABP8FXT9_9SPHI